jgi:hypothetical protein
MKNFTWAQLMDQRQYAPNRFDAKARAKGRATMRQRRFVDKLVAEYQGVKPATKPDEPSRKNGKNRTRNPKGILVHATDAEAQAALRRWLSARPLL